MPDCEFEKLCEAIPQFVQDYEPNLHPFQSYSDFQDLMDTFEREIKTRAGKAIDFLITERYVNSRYVDDDLHDFLINLKDNWNYGHYFNMDYHDDNFQSKFKVVCDVRKFCQDFRDRKHREYQQNYAWRKKNGV